ncbi:hypothetical protein ACFHW2_35860 [Actinomadura sp. LOL_016]|uniref:hypothetical protein n=1 Tax=unclassified Actinomadura TaxID=2626254 RepID=UPI003A7FB493
MSDPYLTEIGWAGTALRVAGRFDHGGSPLELLLRERDGEALVRVPATPGADDAFEALIDVAAVEGGNPLPGGVWDVDLSIGPETMPLGRERAPGLDASPQRRFLTDGTTVAVYLSPLGSLAIDVGGRPHAAGAVRADGLSWDEPNEHVLITGHLALDLATPISATLNLREHGGRTYEVICMLDDRPEGLHYTAVLPVSRTIIDRPLPRGAWDVWLCLGFSGMHRELRVLAPSESVDVRVWRRLWHVRVASTTAPEPLTITVGRA